MDSDDDAMDLETATVIDSDILQLDERDLLYQLNYYLRGFPASFAKASFRSFCSSSARTLKFQWEAELSIAVKMPSLRR